MVANKCTPSAGCAAAAGGFDLPWSRLLPRTYLRSKVVAGARSFVSCNRSTPDAAACPSHRCRGRVGYIRQGAAAGGGKGCKSAGGRGRTG